MPHCIRISITAILLLLGASLHADSDRRQMEEVFAPYAQLLQAHLQEKTPEAGGLVSAFDYRAALADPKTETLIEEQRALLAEFDLASLDQREPALAFWNNAYNYFMLDKILTDRPGGELIESVWDYGGRYNPFRANVFERELFTIAGEKFSLDAMEKGVLLGDDFKEKGWKEARVHFTVNCASVGCPPLRAQIYTADNIDALMSENTRKALNTSHHLYLDGTTLYVTELFKWYESDYVNEAGSVTEFIKMYGDDAVVEKLEGAERIRYIDYDWRLNKPDNFAEFTD